MALYQKHTNPYRYHVGNTLTILSIVILLSTIALYFLSALSFAFNWQLPTDSLLYYYNPKLEAIWNFTIFAILPITAITIANQHGFMGMWKFFEFKPTRKDAIIVGILLVTIILANTIGHQLLAQLGYERQYSEIAVMHLRRLGFITALALALGAAIGEEIIFRGILLKYTTNFNQAALFGIAHIGYFSVLQLIGTSIMGWALGDMRKKGLSLTGAILIHALINTMFVIAAFYII